MSTRELAGIVAEGRWDDFAALADNRFFRLALEHPAELTAAFEAAPDDWVRRHPRQNYQRAALWALNKRFAVFESDPLENLTAWVSEQDPVLTRDAVTLLVAQLQYHRFLGQFDEALRVADEIERAIDSSTDYVDFEDFVVCMFFPIGATRLMVGDGAGAISAFSSALRWSRHWQAHPAERHARNYLATALALVGDYTAAGELIDPDKPVRQSAEGTLGYLYECGGSFAPALITLGRYDRYRTAAALERIDEDAEADEFWWLGIHVRALWQLHWGDPAEAAALIERSLLTFRQLASPRSMALTLLIADLADAYQALGLLDRATTLLDQSEILTDSARVIVSRSRIHNLSGDPRRALALLDAAGVSGKFVPTPAAWYVQRANAFHLLGDEDRAGDELREAAAAMARLDDRLAFVECVEDLRPRLAELVDDAPDPRLLYRTSQPVSLTVRELEVLDALRRHTSVREISQQLFLSQNTIKTHLRNVYRKLGVNTREAALVAAAKKLDR